MRYQSTQQNDSVPSVECDRCSVLLACGANRRQGFADEAGIERELSCRTTSCEGRQGSDDGNVALENIAVKREEITRLFVKRIRSTASSGKGCTT